VPAITGIVDTSYILITAGRNFKSLSRRARSLEGLTSYKSEDIFQDVFTFNVEISTAFLMIRR
jgi:hypothetical protein